MFLKLPLCRVFDVSIDQQAVHLRMNIFNCYLKPVKASCFGDLHLLTEPLNLKWYTMVTTLFQRRKWEVVVFAWLIGSSKLSTFLINADRKSQWCSTSASPSISAIIPYNKNNLHKGCLHIPTPSPPSFIIVPMGTGLLTGKIGSTSIHTTCQAARQKDQRNRSTVRVNRPLVSTLSLWKYSPSFH